MLKAEREILKAELESADEGNVLNIIAKALVARRAAIDEEAGEEVWVEGEGEGEGEVWDEEYEDY